MRTAGAARVHGASVPSQARLLRLPLKLADFERRGFRLDHPDERVLLETHARNFLTGFNLAAKHWRDPHPALSCIEPTERGFAYEGAAMYAALRDAVPPGGSDAMRRLCEGTGDDYIHLIHVGYGWAGAVPRMPVPDTIPATPLLRWLALDGAGFAAVYFGGLRALRRRWDREPTQRWQARAAGFGRALWFVESASVDGVTRVINEAPPQARPHLWSGIALACCYAGGADLAQLDRLVHSCGTYWPHFGQGALFAIAARARAGHVPAHTAAACRHLFAVSPDNAREWTDIAATGLTGSPGISAYSEWKSRLRDMVTAPP